MGVEQLLISKEEIPIKGKRCFIVPIHPGLLRDDISLDPRLANEVFSGVADSWYHELQEYVANLDDAKEKEWILDVFLKHEPIINFHSDNQVMRPCYWEDLVINMDNGFAHVLSISRNAGGSLFLAGDRKTQYIASPLVDFPRSKLDAYAVERFDGIEGVYANAYDHHNVEFYPGALFLRNWAIAYLNAAMRSVGDRLLEK